MSNLQLIDRLSRLLEEAVQIIREQAELMSQHGIETDAGRLERQRAQLLEDIKKTI